MLKIIVLFALVGFAKMAIAQDHGRFEDLGVQITSLTLQGTAFAKDPAGRELVCAVIRGQPAKLLVFDVKSGELVHRLALEDAHGAWNATTASDGSVYVSTDDNGHLYRWIPGEQSIHDLGQVAPDQTFAWDVTAGRDGEVFVGTYPGCQVIRYHPADGFSDAGKGNVAPGENYARGITYDAATGKVYVGVGAHARLIEVDPKTGDKQNILPKEFADKKFVYSVRMAAGKLFALVTDGTDCLVVEPATRKVEAVIPDVGAQLVVSQPSPYDADKVYLKGMGKLLCYDFKTQKAEPVAVEGAAAINGMAWIKFDGEHDLVIATQRGRLIRYHPKTGKSSSIQTKVPPESTPIQYIARGPDGRIFTGGYLSGGLSAFDPKTNTHKQLGNTGQPESIGVMGSRMYLGVYPRARLFTYDPSQAWEASAKNPRMLEELDRFDQDRPFATLCVEKLNKVFFGTVSDYGVLGGALAIYDAQTDKTDVHRNVVQDQSIVSLAYANDTVIGGTTISGGLGIEPKEKKAKLFLWDTKTNRKIFETAPVPSASIITGLIIGPDGNIWGTADRMLFIFDVAKRSIVFSKELFPPNAVIPHARWRDTFMALHRDGNIYGTKGGRLFRIDPATKELTVLREKEANLLAIDDAGSVYFSNRANLWRYIP